MFFQGGIMIVKYIGDYSEQNYIDWNLNFRIKVNMHLLPLHGHS